MVLPTSWASKPCRHILKTFIKKYNADPKHAAQQLHEASAQIANDAGDLITHETIGAAVNQPSCQVGAGRIKSVFYSY